MITCKNKQELQYFFENNKTKSIGFVPTMGALHNGHISLIAESKKHNDITVCSIFVNPTQFNDKKDFDNYPITIEIDTKMLDDAGCDMLFLPSVLEMYPNGISNLEQYNLGEIETLLEGAFRAGHYQGVCQVVYRLLKAILPQNLYLGQKDYQQCMVINKMIEITDLANIVKVQVCAILREKDGLAMSSRNMRLTAAERLNAVNIKLQLKIIKNNLAIKPFDVLKNEAKDALTALGFVVDYVSIANAITLHEETIYNPTQKYVALVAAFCGQVRLIDNMVL
jgi:pantoate--beta-alanine ligase